MPLRFPPLGDPTDATSVCHVSAASGLSAVYAVWLLEEALRGVGGKTKMIRLLYAVGVVWAWYSAYVLYMQERCRRVLRQYRIIDE